MGFKWLVGEAIKVDSGLVNSKSGCRAGCMLLTAVGMGIVNITSLLLDSNADVDNCAGSPIEGETALMLAIKSSNLTILETILDRSSPNMNDIHTKKHPSALITAYSNFLDIPLELIHNTTTSKWEQRLMARGRSRSIRISALLVYHGASVEKFMETVDKIKWGGGRDFALEVLRECVRMTDGLDDWFQAYKEIATKHHLPPELLHFIMPAKHTRLLKRSTPHARREAFVNLQKSIESTLYTHGTRSEVKRQEVIRSKRHDHGTRAEIKRLQLQVK